MDVVRLSIMEKKNILILCTGNSCRSQIAHGYFQNLVDINKVTVYSAGIETHGVNPMAIATMKDDNIDISKFTSNNVSEYLDIQFDHIITVCDHASEKCPSINLKAIKTHFNFPNPAKAHGTDEEITYAFRNVRNMIKDFCVEFITEHNLH